MPRGSRSLATAIGRDLGISEREVLDLEYAALLHDIGQVSLARADPPRVPRSWPRRPTSGGSPTTARRSSGRPVCWTNVAQILEAQTTPYRQVREFDEELPVASRIIKVANAYEDLAGARPEASRRLAAMERINLGLGYEYDPRVVDSLARVLRRTS